ncbi:uncharacterized protein LOC131668894 [Phymastichus coffea]|uniref:uncharacterized protein LOC131668894 n=1 Tax=Phymastichus coffea TaxID=108790 RepID=UPI00273C8A60|nr:uncharacterized protein LOC131668894 [Phymastichus coffea]
MEKLLTYCLTFFSIALHNSSVFACSGKPIVSTLSGKVQGARQKGFEGNEFCSFKGIPYAKPPVAELRFSDPEPVEPWMNVREATTHGPNCPQYNTIPHHVSTIEDCLYLNVYTKNTEPRVLKPVMVWIHGGSFATGHGDDSLYGPDYFMRKDIVLVTFNYRLGVLGFLNLNDEGATGNQGLKDQIMAMQWVRDNIVSFGGDPYSVTIFGQSTGAASVHYHTISPLSKGLFHKAISQSGVALNPWAFQSNPEKRAYQLCQLLGHRVKDSKSAIRFLKSVDTPRLIRAQEKLLTKEEIIQAQLSFGPSIDSKLKMPFMPTHPEVAAATGVQVPMIIGHNSREGIFFYRNAANSYERFNREFSKLLHPDVRDMVSRYGLTTENLKHIYFKNSPITRSNVDKLVDLLGDLYFVEGIHRVVKTQAATSLTPTYFYEFTYDKKQSFMKIYFHTHMSGACHADELSFLFKAHHFDVISKEKDTDKKRITKQMIDLWVNFAMTGTPTPRVTDLIPLYWEPIGDGKILRYLNICEDLRMGTMSSLEQKYNAYMYFITKNSCVGSIMSECVIIDTLAGKVRGAKQRNFEDDEFYAFRGIPYAKPPVGELRFQEPQPVEPWTGIREATSHGPNCAQLDFIVFEVAGSDDCLYLNVYTRNIEAGARRPVMVWIHGGGFILGHGDDSFYGPDFFMRKDVVLVTINYRLGVLGFLNLDDEEASGNQGLKDQVMALKWVRDNIVNFGGDSENVTIFGESAGGASVHYLCISSLAKGLFHKAIAQSGVALNPWAFQSNATEKAYKYCEFLGHKEKDPKSAITFLRTVDIQKLIEAQENLPTKEEKIQFKFSFGPSIDSKSKNPFMPVHPEEAAKQGIEVPLIIGHNSREGLIFLREIGKAHKRFNTELEKLVNSRAWDVMKNVYNLTPEQVKHLYLQDEEITDQNVEKLIDLLGDINFNEGIHRVVKTQIEKSSAPTYFYQFTYDKDPSLVKLMLKIKISGASHADEVLYLFPLQSFNTLRKQYGIPKKSWYQMAKWFVMTLPLIYLVKYGNHGFPKRGSDKYRIMEHMIEMWTNFAITGKPTIQTSELIPHDWQPVDNSKNLCGLNISENLRIDVTENLEQKYISSDNLKN